MFGGILHVVSRGAAQRDWDSRSRYPEVHVRATSAVLIDIHANNAFAEGIDGSEGYCAS
jgi:hypothetical protein